VDSLLDARGRDGERFQNRSSTAGLASRTLPLCVICFNPKNPPPGPGGCCQTGYLLFALAWAPPDSAQESRVSLSQKTTGTAASTNLLTPSRGGFDYRESCQGG
jgi:hypothetical protein